MQGPGFPLRHKSESCLLGVLSQVLLQPPMSWVLASVKFKQNSKPICFVSFSISFPQALASDTEHYLDSVLSLFSVATQEIIRDIHKDIHSLQGIPQGESVQIL